MGVREARKVLDDFLKNTSCNGINQIRISKKKKAIGWLSCTLMATLVCVFQLVNIVREVRKKDVMVQTLVSIAKWFTYIIDSRNVFTRKLGLKPSRKVVIDSLVRQ